MDTNKAQVKVLIVDDDRNVHETLSAYLYSEDYQFMSAYNGDDALNILREKQPDIVILDVIMQGKDGFTICQEIRRESNVPIIMLSAKTDEFDRLLGLELGADDYVTKPYSPREIVARIKAIMRRINECKLEKQSSHIVIDNLEIDMNAYVVKLNGNNVPCTPKEIEILWELVSNPGIVFSREHLLQSIWGYEYLGDTRAVDSHIKRIRAKLCVQGNRWDIRTVWGVGYRFEIEK